MEFKGRRFAIFVGGPINGLVDFDQVSGGFTVSPEGHVVWRGIQFQFHGETLGSQLQFDGNAPNNLGPDEPIGVFSFVAFAN